MRVQKWQVNNNSHMYLVMYDKMRWKDDNTGSKPQQGKKRCMMTPVNLTMPKEDHDDASLGRCWCKRRTTIMCEKDHNNTRRGLWKQKGRTRQCDKRAATRLGKDHINAGREPRQCWRRTTTMPVKTMTISYEDYDDAGSRPYQFGAVGQEQQLPSIYGGAERE